MSKRLPGKRKFDIRQRFGKRVRQLRKGQGMTQEQLSRKIGWGLSVIGIYERGEVGITIDNIERLAEGLGAESYELFIVSDLDKDYKDKVSVARMKRLVEGIGKGGSEEQTRLLQMFLELLIEWSEK